MTNPGLMKSSITKGNTYGPECGHASLRIYCTTLSIRVNTNTELGLFTKALFQDGVEDTRFRFGFLQTVVSVLVFLNRLLSSISKTKHRLHVAARVL